MSAAELPPSLNIACRLVVGEVSLRVGQICQSELVIDEAVNIPAGSDADLIVQVNGKRKVYRIFLPLGVQQGVELTPYY